MTSLPVTSIFVAIFAIALVVLSVPISVRRAKIGVLIGEGTDESLRRRIRAQGNFIEYVPLALIALGLIELRGAPASMVLAIGGALIVARLLHAIGMWRDIAALRGLGMTLTHLILVFSAIRLIGY